MPSEDAHTNPAPPTPPTPPTLRRELPEVIGRIARLPVHRGYPVPWFVAWLEDGSEVRPERGEPDFRVIAAGKIAKAHLEERCWVCGTSRQGRYVAFVIGPMCAVNRVSSEPPSHVDCAEWSAMACPFLTRPHMDRREDRIPEGAEKAAGKPIDRNPGVALVWVTRSYRIMRPPDGGVLFRIGDPERVLWYTEGREATRAEVMASIESGLPILRAEADAQGDGAVRALDRQYERALNLIPA